MAKKMKETAETEIVKEQPETQENAPAGEAQQEQAAYQLTQEQFDELKARIDALQKERDEYMALAQRVQADFDNFRRRNTGVRAESLDRGREGNHQGAAARTGQLGAGFAVRTGKRREGRFRRGGLPGAQADVRHACQTGSGTHRVRPARPLTRSSITQSCRARRRMRSSPARCLRSCKRAISTKGKSSGTAWSKLLNNSGAQRPRYL